MNYSTNRSSSAVFCGVWLALALFFNPSAQAGTDHLFVVNSVSDSSRSGSAPASVCTTGSTVQCPAGSCVECSLRAAIETVNSLTFGQTATIEFADYIETNSGNPVASMFFPVNGYNSLARQVHIDGTTHPAWDPADGIPRVIIRGENAIATAHGLNFTSGGSGSIVDAVAVYDFPQAGIRINADQVHITQSHVGINASGTSARPNAVGILVLGNDNVIGHLPMSSVVAPWPNIISGNDGHGVEILGDHNLIGGNYIGLNKAGALARGNGGHGIRVAGSNNRIGEHAFSDGFPPISLISDNVVAGNAEDQILIAIDGTQTTMACTSVGTNATVSGLVAGSPQALTIHSSGNSIGNSACRNVFGGAVVFGDADDASTITSNNTFHDNFAGTNAAGDDLGVTDALVTILNGNGNLILDNTIGNGVFGIALAGGTSGTGVRGNHIGTDSQGRAHPLLGGIISSGVSNAIGGTQTLDANIVGNVPDGVAILTSSSSQANLVVGNWVGTSPDGTPLPVAVGIESGGSDTVIGLLGAGNVIGHVEDYGIRLNALSSGAQVIGNWVGVSPDGDALGDQTGEGIRIDGDDHDIGQGNVVGHFHTGILVNADGNRIFDNYIGTDSSGEAYPNGSFGIRITGDTNSVSGNWIGNSARGIRVNSSAEVASIFGNWVGVTPTGLDIGNSVYGVRNTGMLTFLGADVISSPVSMAPNVIGFNGVGVSAGGWEAIWGNYIGVTSDNLRVGNSGAGILVESDTLNTGISDQSTDDYINWIGENGGHGIEIHGNDTFIGQNVIGVLPNGLGAGNGGDGIFIGSGVSATLIRGQTNAPANNLFIANNDGRGIAFHADAGTGNEIRRANMHRNLVKAIDLGPGGRDQDPGDGDTGPNNLQNFPEFQNEFSGFNPVTGQVEMRFRVDSHPSNSAYPITVDVYRVISTNTPQGRTWLESITYEQADAQTFINASFTPALVLEEDEWFAAVAIDSDGNASELSEMFGGPPVYSIGGVISGLGGSGLELQNNGGDDLVVTQTGTFSFQFDTPLPDGASYDVTVSEQPGGQLCTVSNGTGTVSGSAVNDVQVDCQAADDAIFHDRFEPMMQRGASDSH